MKQNESDNGYVKQLSHRKTKEEIKTADTAEDQKLKRNKAV